MSLDSGEKTKTDVARELKGILIRIKSVCTNAKAGIPGNYSAVIDLPGASIGLSNIMARWQTSGFTNDEVGEAWIDRYNQPFTWASVKSQFSAMKTALDTLAANVASEFVNIHHSADPATGAPVYDQPLSTAKNDALIAQIDAVLAEYI